MAWMDTDGRPGRIWRGPPQAAKAVTQWPLSREWEDYENRLAVSILLGWGFWTIMHAQTA